MRKLVTLQRVNKIQPIEGADKIVCIGILGWNLVTQKSNNLQIGDWVAYFEIDSFLPIKEHWEFLRPSSYKFLADGSEGFRIKTMKFRGQVSQGFALPIQNINDVSSLNFFKCIEDKIVCTLNEKLVEFKEGDELTNYFDVVKYEPPVPACLSGVAKGYIPGWLETDETRVQLLQGLLDKYKGQFFYKTEKLDGSSCTYFIDENNEFHVCSRNLDLEKDETNSMWKWAIENDVEERLRRLSFKACIQGEIIGEGIQGNKYKLKGQDVRFFNVINIEERKALGFEEFLNIIEEVLGFETVPILEEGLILTNDIETLVLSSKGKSVLNNNTEREGIVLRPLKSILDGEFDLPHSRVSFKVINPKFLLDNDE